MIDRQPLAASRGPLDEPRLQRLLSFERSDRRSTVLRVVELYLQGAPRLLASMRRAIEAGSPGGLAVAAQSLKLSSTHLGAEELASLCRDLEVMGRGGSIDGARDLWRQAAEACDGVCSALRVWSREAA